jgi:hypothetical protein
MASMGNMGPGSGCWLWRRSRRSVARILFRAKLARGHAERSLVGWTAAASRSRRSSPSAPHRSCVSSAWSWFALSRKQSGHSPTLPLIPKIEVHLTRPASGRRSVVLRSERCSARQCVRAHRRSEAGSHARYRSFGRFSFRGWMPLAENCRSPALSRLHKMAPLLHSQRWRRRLWTLVIRAPLSGATAWDRTRRAARSHVLELASRGLCCNSKLLTLRSL